MIRMNLPVGVTVAPREPITIFLLKETDDLDLEHDELFQITAPGRTYTFSPQALFRIMGYLPIREGFFLVMAESTEWEGEKNSIEEVKNHLLAINSTDWNLLEIIN